MTSPATRQARGPAAFTTLWTSEQVRRIGHAGIIGSPLQLTFGGPHTSAPRFSRAGMRPGDDAFFLRVAGKRLYVLGMMSIAEILPAEAFVARHHDLFEPIRMQLRYQQLAPKLDSEHLRGFLLLRLWLEAHPEIEALCPGEADEVVLAAAASAIRVDLQVPLGVVRGLQWQSRRYEARPIRHLDDAGLIERVISLQGIYNLTPDSAESLRTVLGDAGNPPTLIQSASMAALT